MQSDKSDHKKTLKTVVQRFAKSAKKGVQIGGLAAALTANSTINTGCSPMLNEMDNDSMVIENSNTPTQPYDKLLGNTYNIHNFMGKEPDIIASTAKIDVMRY